jgi:cobalt-precorrin 5A hydrolase
MGSARVDRLHNMSIAIVAITRHGVDLALQLQAKLPGSVCYVPERHQFAVAMGATGFQHVGSVFSDIWGKHRALICIMSTGIVVRRIASLLRHKTVDPAVVVLDERGQFVISLVSGHLGGANRLATQVAELLGGQAVITTASDVRGKPSIDLIAIEGELEVEDPGMLKRAGRAILEDEAFWIYDPGNRVRPFLAEQPNVCEMRMTIPGQFQLAKPGTTESREATTGTSAGTADDPSRYSSDPKALFGIWVGEYHAPEDFFCLQLRPRTLVVGVGCNRDTPAVEILDFVRALFLRENLSLLSIRNLASIAAKADEAGILKAAEKLDRPVSFFTAEEIDEITVPNPSEVVGRHMGVKSVCEAAALKSARRGTLIIEKQKTPNVTLAVARVDYT